LVAIRSVYAHAKKNNRVIQVDHYPCDKGKYLIKFLPSDKNGLNMKEVILLEKADLWDKPRLDHARNLWLFAFHFAGVRVSDTLLL